MEKKDTMRIKVLLRRYMWNLLSNWSGRSVCATPLQGYCADKRFALVFHSPFQIIRGKPRRRALYLRRPPRQKNARWGVAFTNKPETRIPRLTSGFLFHRLIRDVVFKTDGGTSVRRRIHENTLIQAISLGRCFRKIRTYGRALPLLTKVFC